LCRHCCNHSRTESRYNLVVVSKVIVTIAYTFVVINLIGNLVATISASAFVAIDLIDNFVADIAPTTTIAPAFIVTEYAVKLIFAIKAIASVTIASTFIVIKAIARIVVTISATAFMQDWRMDLLGRQEQISPWLERDMVEV